MQFILEAEQINFRSLKVSHIFTFVHLYFLTTKPSVTLVSPVNLSSSFMTGIRVSDHYKTDQTVVFFSTTTALCTLPCLTSLTEIKKVLLFTFCGALYPTYASLT